MHAYARNVNSMWIKYFKIFLIFYFIIGVVDSEKVVDLQSQVNALKNELVSHKEHLAKARQATKQYAEIATASEKQAKELNETATQYVSRYEDLLASSNEQQKSLKDKIALLVAAKNDLETQTNQGRQVAANGAANVQQLEAMIEGNNFRFVYIFIL